MFKALGFFALLCVFTLIKANAKTENYVGTVEKGERAPASYHVELVDDEVEQVINIRNNDATFVISMGQNVGYKIACSIGYGYGTLFVYPEMKLSVVKNRLNAMPMMMDLTSYAALSPKFGNSYESCVGAQNLLASASPTSKVRLKFKGNTVSIEAVK